MADVASHTGRIVQLNVSQGGAPKWPVSDVLVTEHGIEGDRQRKRNHGGPSRAVMLYSVEQIARLRAAGHPIVPGAVGENVTTEGIDLGVLAPGDRLRLGGEVELEITLYPTPCDGIGGAFLHRDFTQVWHERHPGMSRLAARVLRAGRLAVGQVVEVIARGGERGSRRTSAAPTTTPAPPAPRHPAPAAPLPLRMDEGPQPSATNASH